MLISGWKHEVLGSRDGGVMWKKVLFGVLVVISAMIGFGIAKVQSRMDVTFNRVTRDTENVFREIALPEGVEAEADDGIINILLLGSDERKEANFESNGLMDAMMIATLDKKHDALKLTTLMRDTVVRVAGTEEDRKINSAVNDGGVEGLYQTIALNYHIKLDGYVMVTFTAFEKVVNAIGGVEIELTDTEMRYLNCTNYVKSQYHKLKVGKQVVNGNQALGYCRIRKGKDKIGEPVVTVNGLTDDYGRTWRQRTLLTSIFNKVKTLPKTRWLDIADDVASCIRTDLDNESIYGYLGDIITMGTTTIHQLQTPSNGYFRYTRSGEFPYCSGEGLVPTNGRDSEYSHEKNEEIMKSFIFDFNGKGEFIYKDPDKTEEDENDLESENDSVGDGD